MKAVAMTTFTCGRCCQSWRQPVSQRKPRKCQVCGQPNWEFPNWLLQTKAERVKQLLAAARDVFIGNDLCHIGIDLNGRFVALPPAQASRWRSLPERYGRLIALCTRKDHETVIQNAVLQGVST